MNLAYWLRSKPSMVQLRCATPAGERILQVDRGNARPYAALAKSVAAIGATRIEALDDKGAILQAVDLLAEADEESAAEELERVKAAQLVAPDTPEQKTLALLAQLLSDAYRTAQETVRQEHETAWKQMVELSRAGNERAKALEKSLASLERMYTRLVTRAAGAQPEGEENPLAQMAAHFFAGQMGATLPMPNGKVSGARPTTPAPAPEDAEGEGDGA